MHLFILWWMVTPFSLKDFYVGSWCCVVCPQSLLLLVLIHLDSRLLP